MAFGLTTGRYQLSGTVVNEVDVRPTRWVVINAQRHSKGRKEMHNNWHLFREDEPVHLIYLHSRGLFGWSQFNYIEILKWPLKFARHIPT